MLKSPPLSLIPPTSVDSSTSPPIMSPPTEQQRQSLAPAVTSPSFTPVQPTLSTPRAASTIFSRAASAIVSFFSSAGIDQNSQSYQTFQSIPIQSSQPAQSAPTMIPTSSPATQEAVSSTGNNHANSNPSSATKKDVVYDKNNSLIYGSSPYFSSNVDGTPIQTTATSSTTLTIGRREIIQLNNVNSERKVSHTQPLYPAPSSLLSSVPIARLTNNTTNNTNNNYQSPSSDTSTDNQSASPPNYSVTAGSSLRASSSSQHLPPVKNELASTPKSSTGTSSSQPKLCSDVEDRTIFTQQAADSLLLLSSMKTGVSSVPVQQKKPVEHPSPAELFAPITADLSTAARESKSIPTEQPTPKTFSNKKAPPASFLSTESSAQASSLLNPIASKATAPASPPLAAFGIPTIKAHLPPPRSRSTTTETLASNVNNTNANKNEEELAAAAVSKSAPASSTNKSSHGMNKSSLLESDVEFVGKRTRKPAKKYSDEEEEDRKKAIVSSKRDQERYQKQQQQQQQKQQNPQDSNRSYYSSKNDRSSASRGYGNDYYNDRTDRDRERERERESSRDRRLSSNNHQASSFSASRMNGMTAAFPNKSSSSFLQNTNSRIFPPRKSRDEYEDLVSSPVRDPFEDNARHSGTSYHHRSSSSGGRDGRGENRGGGGGYEDYHYSTRSRDDEDDRFHHALTANNGNGNGNSRGGRTNSGYHRRPIR
jgi:hypothetical protein